MLLGSVASDVVRRSGRPVLLVRPSLSPLRRLRRKILVPLDAPEDVASVIDGVSELALAGDSEIVLFHVLPFPLVTDPVTGFSPIPFRPLDLPGVPWIRDAVREVKRRGLHARARTAFGDPVDRILKVCRSEDVDLVAMRTRSRTGLSRVFLGSVADQVVRQIERPLLLIHPALARAARKTSSTGESRGRD
jgi:nucleotide-binding universal stress UspA family protein